MISLDLFSNLNEEMTDGHSSVIGFLEKENINYSGGLHASLSFLWLLSLKLRSLLFIDLSLALTSQKVKIIIFNFIHEKLHLNDLN